LIKTVSRQVAATAFLFLFLPTAESLVEDQTKKSKLKKNCIYNASFSIIKLHHIITSLYVTHEALKSKRKEVSRRKGFCLIFCWIVSLHIAT
jgi:hypothetical protein